MCLITIKNQSRRKRRLGVEQKEREREIGCTTIRVLNPAGGGPALKMLPSKQPAVIFFIVNFLRVSSELTASFQSVHILVHWKEQCWLKNDWDRFAQNHCTQKKRVHLSDVGVGWRKRSGMDSILHQMRSFFHLQRVG